MEYKTNQQNNGQGFAIASLVIGIFALLFSIIPCVGTSSIIIGAVAVVFGTLALTRANAADSPKGLSIAGISLGGAAIVIAIIWLVFIVGAKNVFEDKFQGKFDHFTEWADEFDNIDIETEDFNNTESLKELESALDELEGVMDEVNAEINDSLNEVHNDAKKAINKAREEINDAKKRKQDQHPAENK